MENQPSEPGQEQKLDAAPKTEAQPAPIITSPSIEVSKPEGLAHKINRITAIILIVSGSVFVLIAILAIWQVFGKDNSDVVWRALGSLGAIALGALIVSVASKLVDEKH